MITLKTLPFATEQEVLDQVVAHLLTQNARSQLPLGGPCVYRGPRGLKCAAGCLISDQEYHPSWLDKRWAVLVDAGEVPATHKFLIADLQRIHDNISVRQWEKHLRGLALEHCLTFNFKGNENGSNAPCGSRRS